MAPEKMLYNFLMFSKDKDLNLISVFTEQLSMTTKFVFNLFFFLKKANKKQQQQPKQKT